LITLRHTTDRRTPLDERSARRRDLWQNKTFTTDRHLCPGGIRTRNPSKRAAADPRLGTCGHWNRQQCEFDHKQCDGRSCEIQHV